LGYSRFGRCRVATADLAITSKEPVNIVFVLERSMRTAILLA
jgi:hypothetical protein